jgi:hypothetical protein
MPWQDVVIECIRVSLNDLDVPYTYEDTRLQRISVTAAAQVMNEAEFQSAYIVDIHLQSITPDPTDTTVNSVIDNPFIALVALKACCLTIKGEMKKYALMGGIQVKDGPSSISTNGLFNNYSTLYKQYLDDYNYLKMNYKLVAAWANAQAILTATTVRTIYGNTQVLPY